MTAAERLKYIIEELKETPSSFATSLGLSRADTIYNILKGRGPITLRFAKKVVSAYSNVNIEWLINGQGDIVTEQIKPIKKVEEPIIEYKKLCVLCTEKDKQIKLLEEIINTQRKSIEYYEKYINLLKEKYPEERKVI